MSQFLFKSSASSSGLEATNGQKATIAENLSREGEDFLVTNSGKCGVNTAENTGRREENTQRGEIGGSTVGIGRPAALSSGLSPLCSVHCTSNSVQWCSLLQCLTECSVVTVVEF